MDNECDICEAPDGTPHCDCGDCDCGGQTINEKWFQYDYVCSICDALIEITTKSNVYKPQVCCGEEAIWLSVVDATILPIPTKKEEEMITETPAQTITLTWIENDVPTSKTYTENEVRALVYVNKSNQEKANEWYRKESQPVSYTHLTLPTKRIV